MRPASGICQTLQMHGGQQHNKLPSSWLNESHMHRCTRLCRRCVEYVDANASCFAAAQLSHQQVCATKHLRCILGLHRKYTCSLPTIFCWFANMDPAPSGFNCISMNAMHNTGQQLSAASFYCKSAKAAMRKAQASSNGCNWVALYAVTTAKAEQAHVLCIVH